MKKKKIKNILISSFTDKKFPLFNKVLIAKKKIKSKKINVYVSNSQNSIYNVYFKKFFFQLPVCIDKNLTKILHILRKNNIFFVIPTSDAELLFWSKYKSFFLKNDIHVMISSYYSILNCLDKLRFYNFCQNKKIPVIQTFKKNNFKNYSLKKKFVIKERFGFIKNKVILNLERSKIKNFLSEFNNPIIQTHVSGKEISADCYVSKYKKVIGIVIRERKLIIDGESKISTIINNKSLEKKIKNHINLLNLYGPVMIQGKILNKKLYIFECNTRIGGASTHSINYGLDVIYWALLESLFRKPKLNFYTNKQKSLSQYRFPTDYYN